MAPELTGRYLNLFSQSWMCCCGEDISVKHILLGYLLGVPESCFYRGVIKSPCLQTSATVHSYRSKIELPYPFLCIYRLYNVLLYYICLEMKLCVLTHMRLIQVSFLKL